VPVVLDRRNEPVGVKVPLGVNAPVTEGIEPRRLTEPPPIIGCGDSGPAGGWKESGSNPRRLLVGVTRNDMERSCFRKQNV
jgi:hypothetical protein